MSTTPPSSSSGSRPASLAPSRASFRTLARMSTMLRRNSSSLSKTLSRSNSKSSLKNEAASPPPTASLPSPVPESPAREAAASTEQLPNPHPPHVKSPLAHEAKDTPQPSPIPPPRELTSEPEATPAPTPAPAPAPVRAVTPAPAPEPTPALTPPPAEPQPKPERVVSPEPTPAPAAAPRDIKAEPAVIAPKEVIATPAPVQKPLEEPIPQPHPSTQERPADAFSWGDMPMPTKKASTSTFATQETQPALASTDASAPIPVSTSTSVSTSPPEDHAPKTTVERPADAFAWGDAMPVPTKKASTSTFATRESVPVSVAAPHTVESHPTQPADRHDPYGAAAADSFAWKDDARATSRPPSREALVASPEQSVRTMSKPPSREGMYSPPPVVARTLSPRASKSSIASSYGQEVIVSSRGRKVAVTMDPSEKRGRSRSSIRVSFENGYTTHNDPFADPPTHSHGHGHSHGHQMAVPKHLLSPVYSVNIPDQDEPQQSQETETETQHPAYRAPQPEVSYFDRQISKVSSTTASSVPPVTMPLPALSEVADTRAIHPAPSGYSLGQSSNGYYEHVPYETNERTPLLSRGMPVPNEAAQTAKATVEPPSQNGVNVYAPSVNSMPWPAHVKSFQSSGWREYTLPDHSVYYAHLEYRITTDIDLRSNTKLEAVTDSLDRKHPDELIFPPPGWELWLRDTGKTVWEFVPLRSWINHRDRVLTFETPAYQIAESSTRVNQGVEDDRLDMEYRYWSYIESHPAHFQLPENAHTDAMDVLTWCYTDSVVTLSSQQATPPPFAPQECQELMGLLRSYTDGTNHNPIIHARVIARVHLRHAQWKQHHFRPNRSLPEDATKPAPRSENRIPFRRAFFSIFVSILCLGIPFFFISRARGRRLDEEGGLRSQAPMIILGACACLVSAVILSASVTLLSLPALGDISRIAGMIAILFSVSSMITCLIAFFKFKSDLERNIVYVGGEGMMSLSRRSIVMSLPVVFLSWSVIAFITGITFYSFRGTIFTGRLVEKQPFTEYAHWSVVGGLGGLFGMLFMSLLLARR